MNSYTLWVIHIGLAHETHAASRTDLVDLEDPLDEDLLDPVDLVRLVHARTLAHVVFCLLSHLQGYKCAHLSEYRTWTTADTVNVS